MVSWSAIHRRLLEVAQPWTDGKPQSGQPALPDIDVSHFLDGETQTRGVMMIEDRGCNPKGRLAADDAVDDNAVAGGLGSKRVLQPEPHHAAFAGGYDLCHGENEVAQICIGQIPPVGLKPVIHVIDETDRPEERNLLL